MLIEVLKSKIHRVKVTNANLNYMISKLCKKHITAADIVASEKVHVVNNNNGERFELCVIEGKENSGDVTLNRPVTRKVAKGGPIIIISYAQMCVEEIQNFKPTVVFSNMKKATNYIRV